VVARCRNHRAMGPRGFAVFTAVLVFHSPAVGQEIRGRVLDGATDRPVAGALVRLVDDSGSATSVTLADSAGVYRIGVPGAGVFRLSAERLGYTPMETPPLRALTADAVYPLDLLMRPDPVAIQGFTVETSRVSDEQVDRSVRHMVGLSVRSLRFEPIRYDDIQAHIEAGRVLEDLIRWEAGAGLVVRLTTEGTCYGLRGRCLPIYMNGVPVNQLFAGDWPLDLIYTIVIVSPVDGSIIYPSGAILLYSEGWLR